MNLWAAGVAIALLLAACGTGEREAELPVSTGPLAVARITVRWVDEQREEMMTAVAGDKREVTVHLWYPTEFGGTGEPYVPDLPVLAATLGNDRSSAFARVRGHLAAMNARPAAGGPWPVLIASHGSDMLSAQHTVLLQELVSHGFIVAAIDHPHDASAVKLQDQRVVPFAEASWPRLPMPDPSGNPDANSPYALFYRQRVQQRAADVAFALRRLEAENVAGPLAGTMDLQRVGVFGHSVGGVMAGESCRTEPRVKACLNLDGDSGTGPFYLNDDGSSFERPFMMLTKPFNVPDAQLQTWGLTRETWMLNLQKHRDRTFGSVRSDSYLVSIAGANHQSFTDDSLVMSLLRGRSDASIHRRHLELTRQYSLAFFSKYLKQQPAPLLEVPHAPPEVTVQTWRQP